MPIHTITTDVQFVAHFRGTDERGDAVTAARIPGELRALTPLAAMELYEQLHAARNDVRKQAGLAEIPTPDEGVLVLAFLRALRDEPAGSFKDLVDRWDGVRWQVQSNRLEEAMEPTPMLSMVNGREPAEVI
jgi:hypothetical protein